MSLADLVLNAHKTYTDAIDREDDAREIFYRYVTYNSEGKLNLTFFSTNLKLHSLSLITSYLGIRGFQNQD